MIILPSTAGWIVEYETEEVSKRTGKTLWRETLCTKYKAEAEEKQKELKAQGYNTRLLEAIF